MTELKYAYRFNGIRFAMIIHGIVIKNFRSILKLGDKRNPFRIDCLNNVIIGPNGSGKSNILKALNLFFNNKLSDNTDWDFNQAISYNPKVGRKQARQVEITLYIKPPKRFQEVKKHEKFIIRWQKTWRNEKDTPTSKIEYYAGTDIQINAIIRNEWKDWSQFKSRRLKHWLTKISYKYIPAVRSKNYFKLLKYELFQSLKIGKPDQFNTMKEEIGKSLNQILDQKLTKALSRYTQSDIHDKINLPINSSDLFSILDFSRTKNFSSYSTDYLSERGDGINSLSIPAILSFIHNHSYAEKSRNTKPSMIWGYEEPENNLSFQKCASLVQTILKREDNDIQIFITTHSPIVYYELHEHENNERAVIVVTKGAKQEEDCYESEIKHFVHEDNDTSTDIRNILDYFNSVSTIAKDEISKIKENEKHIEKLKSKLKELSEKNFETIIFTEDKSQKIIRALFSDKSKCEFLSYNGYCNVKNLLPVFNIIQDLIKSKEIILHFDGDHSDNNGVQEKLNTHFKSKNKSLSYFFTPGGDIESFFCFKSHLDSYIDDNQYKNFVKNVWESNRDYYPQIVCKAKSEVMANKKIFNQDIKENNGIVQKIKYKNAFDKLYQNNNTILELSDIVKKKRNESIVSV